MHCLNKHNLKKSSHFDSIIAAMGFTRKRCVAKDCNSGASTSGENVQLNRFRDHTKKAWIDKINRKDWKWTKDSRLCSKHFLPSDYTTESKDKNKSRQKSLGTKKPTLKDDAIPIFFGKMKNDNSRTTTLSSAEKRTEIAKKKAEEIDSVQNLEDLLEKMKEFVLPVNVLKVNNNQDNSVSYLKISLTGTPSVTFCVTIHLSMDLTIWFNGEKVSVCDLIKEAPAKLKSLSCLKKLLVILDEKKIDEKIKSEEEMIDEIVEKIDELPTQSRKINFIKEQLFLVLKKPQGRRYSKELLAMACMWENVSHALYKQIQLDDVITLPTAKHVRRLTSALTVDFDLSENTVAYLKLRMKKLLKKDLSINLILDEIYSLQSVLYANGSFFGNEGNLITKTLLCIMIKSVAGKYRDIVSMTPITNISSEKIYETWMKVVKKLTELKFDVVCTTGDNHKSNMKFYTTHLCKGKLRSYIEHPFATGKKIFLLFDATHLLKCIYNNFRAKESFVCPPFNGAGPNKYPSFGSIEQLHSLELGAPIKFAHKLSDKVLNPLALEKTNVSLATSVFDESTINALSYYGESGMPGFADTAEFLQIIKNWWDVLNVKPPCKGKHKRNKFMEKIDPNNNQEVREYFQRFSTWIKKWQSEFPDFGPRNPTFKALLQTTSATMDLCDYLIENDNDIGYVLLGFLQQDFLESRFGWWRQLSGGNYFCQVLQFLQAEKTIRLRNLVTDGYNLSDIRDVFKASNDEKDDLLTQQSNEALSMMENFKFMSLGTDDKPITYYVAGYIARQLMTKTECEDCQTMFSKDKEPLNVEIDKTGATEDETRAGEAFVDSINRGGLIKPTDLLNIIAAHTNDFWKYIKLNPDILKHFLSSVNCQSLFTKVFLEKIDESAATDSILNATCRSGHKFTPFVTHISNAMFNMFGKNFASEANSKIHQQRKREKSKVEEEEGEEKSAKQKRNPSLMKQQKLKSSKL